MDTAQNVREHRLFAAFGPPLETNRNGDLTFEQKTFGADLGGLVETGTGNSFSSAFHFGGSFLADKFDMLRDRIEHDLSGRVVPTQIVFPSKYFPQTDTEETGAYAQAELRWSRITLIPGSATTASSSTQTRATRSTSLPAVCRRPAWTRTPSRPSWVRRSNSTARPR